MGPLQKLPYSNVAAFRYHSFIHFFDPTIRFSIVFVCIMYLFIKNSVNSHINSTVCILWGLLCFYFKSLLTMTELLHALNYFLKFETSASSLLLSLWNEVISSKPVIMLHGYSLTPALLLSLGVARSKQEAAFAEVCITLHFSLSALLLGVPQMQPSPCFLLKHSSNFQKDRLERGFIVIYAVHAGGM